MKKMLSEKSNKMMKESSMVYETYEENFFSYIDGLLLVGTEKEKELILAIATETYQFVLTILSQSFALLDVAKDYKIIIKRNRSFIQVLLIIV